MSPLEAVALDAVLNLEIMRAERQRRALDSPAVVEAALRAAHRAELDVTRDDVRERLERLRADS